MEGGTMEREHKPEEGFKIEMTDQGKMLIPEIPLFIPTTDLENEVIRNAQIQRRRRS